MLLLLVALLTLVAFVAGYGMAIRRLRARDPEVAAPLSAFARVHEPVRVAFLPEADGESERSSARSTPDGESERSSARSTPEEGTVEWRAAMSDVGERMRGAKVRLVVFAHGSFVGDDPFSIARVIDGAVPTLPEIARALRGFTRAQVSRLLGDLSNFSREYVESFARATGVDATDFVWSGENHHVARVHGAVRLARSIAVHRGGALRPGDRVLLVGHSHGGQLFAILSQLVARARGHELLLAAASARGEDVSALEGHLEVLRRCAIDVITFGTPPRYGWARGARFRLLHVVNHRGAQPRAPSLRGLLHTRHGDYVHHLGGHGSDFPAATAAERSVNAGLDRVLGEGRNLRAWLRHLAHGVRVSPQGRTVLVDYGDDAGATASPSNARLGLHLLPNFWATGLGHAAYTRREAMLFHARLAARELYPQQAEGRIVARYVARLVARLIARVSRWLDSQRPVAPGRLPPGPDA